MADLVLPAHILDKLRAENPGPPQRCGNCFYGQRVPDPNWRLCIGAPPTVVFLGFVPGSSPPRPNLQSCYPTTPASQMRCALWAAGELTQ